MENEYAPIGMGDFFDVHSKAKSREQLLGHSDRIRKSLCTDDRPRRLIRYAEQQVSAALVRKGYAEFVQAMVVELVLGFLELKPLVFRR